MKNKFIENHMEVTASPENLNSITDFIGNILDENGFDQQSILQTAIATEEIFANICAYAYTPNIGMVWIDVSVMQPVVEAVIRFSDGGCPFDPLAVPPPDLTIPSAQREEGGLGIFMMQKLISHVTYRHEDGKNILTVIKQKQTEEKQNAD